MKKPGKIYTERTCKELLDSSDNQEKTPPVTQPLSSYRDTQAYVLLGDPGMGKSTSFEHEQNKQPNSISPPLKRSNS